MSESYTPSVSEEVTTGPSLEEQARDMGIEVPGESPVSPGDVSSSPEPEQILGKFKNQDELAAAYQNLEQRLGQDGPKPNSDMAAVMTQASSYFEEHGQLDDSQYNALAAVGINRGFVDQYIAGQVASTEQATNEYYNLVGGEANYQNMAGWMQSYLPDTEIQAYNNVMEKGSDDEVKVLMSGMYARYNSAVSGYQQLQGDLAPEAPAGFGSRGQVMEALNDPRYDHDEAYRAEFEAKLAVTPEDIF